MQDAIEGPNLLIRFRRGDEWVCGRLCSAGVNGLFIATDTPPRVGEIVPLELSLPDEAAWRAAGLPRPEVTVDGLTVISRAAETRGPPGFSVHVRYRDHRERRDMVRMLEASRGRASLRPPPQRREARYPVSWPILVKVDGRRCRMSALDISRNGMFVGGAAPLPERGCSLDVTFAVDGETAPIRAVTRVTRTIDRDVADRRKLRRGMGLQFCKLGSRNRRDYQAFVSRIAYRSTKRVVVTASGIRLNHLVTELRAVGYAVTSINEGTKLFAMCNDDRNTPDLVIFDASFRDAQPSACRTAKRILTSRVIASAEFDQPFAGPVRALADSILAPVESAWLDQGWGA